MSRFRYDDLEESHKIGRQLEIDQEREPRWFPPARSRREPGRHYFSGLQYQPLPQPANDNYTTDGDE